MTELGKLGVFGDDLDLRGVSKHTTVIVEPSEAHRNEVVARLSREIFLAEKLGEFQPGQLVVIEHEGMPAILDRRVRDEGVVTKIDIKLQANAVERWDGDHVLQTALKRQNEKYPMEAVPTNRAQRRAMQFKRKAQR